MKRKNRVISFLLIVALLAALLPTGALATGASQAAAPEAREEVGNQFQEQIAFSGLNPMEEAQVIAEHWPESAGDASEEAITATEIESPKTSLHERLLERSSAAQNRLATDTYADDEIVRVIVVLEEESLLDQGFTRAEIAANGSRVAREMQTMEARQAAVTQDIQRVVGQVSDSTATVKYHYNVAISGMAIEVPYGALEGIRALDGVASAFVAPTYTIPETETQETVSPATHTTRKEFGSIQTWETGYTGEGMRIAIVDTGLDLDHPSFAAAPPLTETSLTKDEIRKVLPELNAYEAYQGVLGLTADTLYRSDKVPYAFNYVDVNLDVTHDHDSQGDHGTHVAGISAANRMETTDVVGVAPDAQLIVMKVFGATAGGQFDDILACLEDCFFLNVDAVNMSLGSPAGFTSADAETERIFSKILEADMIVSIAAGNSTSAAYMNGYGTNKNFVTDPDNGIVSSPATYSGATMVASLENTNVVSNYFSVGEEKICYSDVAAKPFTGLAGNTYSYVVIPNFGEAADYEGLDVSGKIVLVSRGQIAFTDKQQNAATRGAVACVVYDNADGELSNMQDAGLIPNIFITKADGEKLIAAAVNGEGLLTPRPLDDVVVRPSFTAGQMSDFSSWGVTSDLQLMPDVTAPGGNIYSSLNNGQYGMMSGTSMATPHIAGMAALVLQYLHKEHSELTDSEMHTVAEALTMSTAVPVTEPSGVLYSPRKQGSGSANAFLAVSSPVYLTANNGKERTPKVSFGDDDDKQGVYRFSFEMNNFSTEPHTYTLDGTALTDQFVELNGKKLMGETSRQLDAAVSLSLLGGGQFPTEYDVNGDGLVDIADVQNLLDGVNGNHPLDAATVARFQAMAQPADVLDTADVQALYEMIQADQKERLDVTVEPGQTTTVYVTIALTDADKSYMDENYPNGIYVDGFVLCHAKSEGAVDLSLPFLGFYGDWSQSPVFDVGWYYQMQNAEFNRYPHVFFTDYYYLGMNPYIMDEPYDPAHNVLSPNGDAAGDTIDEIYLGMMRSAKRLSFTWTDAKTGEVYFHTQANNVNKCFYSTTYNLVLPFMYGNEVGKFYDFKDAGGETLANGTKLELAIDAYLDDGDSEIDDSMRIPVTIDTGRPTMDTDSLRLWYEASTDSRKVEFTVCDDQYIAAVALLTEAGGVIDIIPVDNVPGEPYHMEIDVSNCDPRFQIVVCDYGLNETAYEVEFAGEHNEDEAAFYGYRHLSVLPQNGTNVVTDAYNGWYSFREPGSMAAHTYAQKNGETETVAAEYVDGYVIGVDENNTLFTMKMGDWGRMELGKVKLPGMLRYFTFQALDMAFDYTTNTLYCITDEDGSAKRPAHLITIDYRTGEIADVGVVGFEKGQQGVTLACDNDGVLYTINYATGDLYTISKTAEKINNVNTVAVTKVGETGYKPQYWQSMTVDHDTNTLYWSAYQGYAGKSALYEVDKTTGALTLVDYMHQNAEISALFTPYHGGAALYPEEEPLTGLLLSEDSLFLSQGSSQRLRCMPVPFYANLDNVTWSSSDETVAAVSGGVVQAVGAGNAVITAACGELTASCEVTVKSFAGNLTGFNTGSATGWYRADDMSRFAGAQPLESEDKNIYFSAVPVGDAVYAFDQDSNFWRLDPKTMTGTQLGSSVTSGVMSALAMNYADGFLYGVEYVSSSAGNTSYLVQVNRLNGSIRRLANLQEEMGFIYGMTIDHAGNFYAIYMDETGKTTLSKFILMTFGDETFVMNAGILDLSNSYPGSNGITSMYYSSANQGIFWTHYNDLIFLDVSNEENPSAIYLGNFSRTDSAAMFMALHSSTDPLPELPKVPVESAEIPASYRLLRSGTVAVNLDVQPWNSTPKVTYRMADTSVATVSEQGMITGVNPGKTTLTVTIEGYDQTLTADVTVLPGGSTLYGYFVTDYLYSGQWWISMKDYAPKDITPIIDFDYVVMAGDYYDGYIYAIAQSDGEYQCKNVLIKIDPADYSKEVIGKVEYNVMDMAFDYTTGVMYAVVTGGGVNALAQIDLTTGELALVGECDQFLVTLACTAEGKLYSIASDGNLYTVEKTTGALTAVASVGYVSATSYQSMAYDHNSGNVYWIDPYGGMSLLDLETGMIAGIGVVGGSTMEITSLFSVPERSPQIPAAVAPTGVRLQELASVGVGESAALHARVLPISLSSVDQTLTWATSDASVAKVDASGNVTGVGAGTATITATNSAGQTDVCLVTVTPNVRQFYAYDRSNTQWVRFSGSDTAKLEVMRKDAEGETVLAASAYTGKTIYSYDVEGRFYSVDPETFQRTKISDGFLGKYQTHYDDDYGDTFDYYYKVMDASYDDATGKLYVAYELIKESEYHNALQGKWTYCFGSGIAQVDPTDGSFEELFFGDNKRYANLLVVDGMAYAVDTFISGMVDSIDLGSAQPSANTFALVYQYWNLPGRTTGCGFIRDQYTGTVYAIRDLAANGGESILYTMSLTNADVNPMGIIGGGLVVNSLFLR